ncbi:MAG TPA: hypothetical protein VM260_17395, partial [Pirellula sp.]|nr:hypothetical protein [Pirellula sp.]
CCNTCEERAMSPQFDEILLTAYLDDELTVEERAKVVEELRTSEASRRLLEELKSVRDLVVQLHLSRPTRRFEQGPWSTPDLSEVNAVSSPVDTPIVVLNQARWYQRTSFQRLASLATLITIAVCASVISMRPNSKSISQSGVTTTDKSVDPRSREEFGNNVQLETTVVEDRSGHQPKEVGGARVMERGSEEAKSDFASALLEKTRLRPQDPSLAMENDLKSRQSGRAANQPLAAPSPAPSTPKPSGESFGLGNESAAAIGSRADFSLPIVKDNEELERLKSGDSTEFSKRFFYRLEANKFEQQETPKLAEKSDARGKELQIQKRSSIVSDKKKSIQVDGTERESILVEFQIPSENWELGAKQLRKLGIDIPETLPTAEFYEFTATPNESAADSPIDQFVVDVKEAKSTVASNWRFSSVTPQENALNRESENRAKEPAGKVEMGKQKRSSSPPIQIRIRPIK